MLRCLRGGLLLLTVPPQHDKRNMARQSKNTITYFPHPVEDGTRMFVMEQQYGDKGYCCYYKLLQMLGKTENHFLDFSKPKDKLYFAALIKTDAQSLSKMLQTLADLGAIDVELWREYEVIWCQELVDSVAELYTHKRHREPPMRSQIVALYTNAGAITDISNTQSKVKESKVKESKYNNKDYYNAQVEVFRKEIEKVNNEKNCLPSFEVDAFVDYWTELNPSKTKMRHEEERFFMISRRLATWKRNFEKKQNSGYKKPDAKVAVFNKEVRHDGYASDAEWLKANPGYKKKIENKEIKAELKGVEVPIFKTKQEEENFMVAHLRKTLGTEKKKDV